MRSCALRSGGYEQHAHSSKKRALLRLSSPNPQIIPNQSALPLPTQFYRPTRNFHHKDVLDFLVSRSLSLSFSLSFDRFDPLVLSDLQPSRTVSLFRAFSTKLSTHSMQNSRHGYIEPRPSVHVAHSTVSKQSPE